MMAEKAGKKTEKSKQAVAVGKRYSIVSLQSGKAVEAGSEDAVYISKAARRKNQQWDVETAGDGCVKLVNAATGKALDVELEGVEDGTRIHQWEYAGGANQQWCIEPGADGACKVKVRSCGKCMDVVEMSQEDGARLQIWADCDGVNQLWVFKEVKAPAKAEKTPAKAAKAGGAKPRKSAPAKERASKKDSEK